MIYLSPKLTLLMLSVVPPIALGSVSTAHFVDLVFCRQKIDTHSTCSFSMAVTLRGSPIALRKPWARCHRKRRSPYLHCALSRRSMHADGRKVSSRSGFLKSWSLERKRLGLVAYFLVCNCSSEMGDLGLYVSLRFPRIYGLGWQLDDTNAPRIWCVSMSCGPLNFFL